VEGKPYPFYDPVSAQKEISGTWNIDFIKGGPELPPSKQIDRLQSWTDFGDDNQGLLGYGFIKSDFPDRKGKLMHGC
jgi:hypothetical protein